jgi:hypothetical protein
MLRLVRVGAMLIMGLSKIGEGFMWWGDLGKGEME